jgi:dTDP-4-dehydrorhamnose 3,5-epimerase
MDQKIIGVKIFENKFKDDDRGYFRRISDRSVLENEKVPEFNQSSFSFNRRAGTVRGIHFQASPSIEYKFVTCVRGSFFDCLVDVRRDSETYGTVNTYEITEENGLNILIPPGVAHGFQTLLDDTYVHYQMSDFHQPDLARRIHWNDPYLNISWPLKLAAISPLDMEGAKWPVEY